MCKENGTVNGAPNGAGNEALVTCQSAQGNEIHAKLARMTRFVAVFEIYSPTCILRASEVLSDFRIVAQKRVIYSGRAVVRSLLNTSGVTLCEATLNDGSWRDIEFGWDTLDRQKLHAEFTAFLKEWERLYRLAPAYKIVIADMQSFFADLRIWLEQIELGVRSSPVGDRLKLEEQVTEELAETILPCIDEFFQKFESVADGLDEDARPAHWQLMRRLLHPYVLSSPFAYRAFSKPLGYAGDYELVNMMMRNAPEGSSLFGKIINTWFVRQKPAQAHRNRIEYLTQLLNQEGHRVRVGGRALRIYNLACGPAQEVQRFLTDSPLADSAEFTMVDFNEETLRYVGLQLDGIKKNHSRTTKIEYLRRSVHHILKESARTINRSQSDQYDFVYCAGLFDYLSDHVCSHLMNIMYDWLAPGGLLVVTNVEPSNPMRNGMDHLLDWHLVYRTSQQMQKLIPAKATAPECDMRSDPTGVNLFLEIRRSKS